MVAALDFFTSWFTPTSLFLFINLVIGTIAITSRFSHQHHNHDDRQQPLTRTPSLLHRLKSIDFSFYRLPPQEPNTAVSTEPESTTRFERAPSFLDRVRSFKISNYINNTEPEYEAERKEVVGSDHHVTRSVSEPREHKVNEKKLKKWGSEKEVMVEKEEIKEEVERRRPATVRLDKRVSFGDEEVDEKADDFINRFKQQLKLQRLDSLIRYRDMLRGRQRT